MTREQQMMDSAKLAEQNSRTIDLSKKQVFISAYIQGWLEADSHSQWIPVEDGLPNEKGTYLFHFDDGQTRVEGYFPELHLSKCVTHWMPLPQPPKKMSNINKDIYEQQQDELAFAKRMIQNSFYGDYCLEKCYCNLTEKYKK